MSVCQTGGTNSAGAGGTGASMTVFLFAGEVLVSETWCSAVAVWEVDEGIEAGIPVGTEARATEGADRRR